MIQQYDGDGFVERRGAQCVQVQPRIGNFIDDGAALCGVAAAQPAQPECTLTEKSQADAGGMGGHQQQVVGLVVEGRDQTGHHHRQQVDAADRQSGCHQFRQPGGDNFRIGQRREQETVVAAFGAVASDQRCRAVG